MSTWRSRFASLLACHDALPSLSALSLLSLSLSALALTPTVLSCRFMKAEHLTGRKTKRRLNEMEVIDVLETKACAKVNYDDYGIKGVTDAAPGEDKLLNGARSPGFFN